MFQGRRLLIATKHQKQKVIAPILEKELGVVCVVLPELDTDKLGTFTGEVNRKDNPIATARNKCLMAMELADIDLAIASEGSFGVHPSLFFVHADDEILLFIDKKNGLEIIVREISTNTNFNRATITNQKHFESFVNVVGFPSHGVILRKSEHDFTDIEKGISDWNRLWQTYHYFMKQYGSVYVETDMRAMYNPTRMTVIESATQKLVSKIGSYCPACGTPGFGITDIEEGLPCQLCQLPTRSILSHIYTCQKCFYSNNVKYPNNRFFEDPMYCDTCNP